MSPFKKGLLTFFTFFPFVYIILFFGVFITLFIQQDGNLIANVFPVLFIVHFLVIILIFGLVAYYVMHAINNKTLDKENDRLIWLLIILLGGPIGIPVYWYMKIWKE